MLTKNSVDCFCNAIGNALYDVHKWIIGINVSISIRISEVIPEFIPIVLLTIISIGIIYYDYVDTDINITEEKAKEIVQKDIDKDESKENLAIKNSKITIEYAKSSNGENVRKSYKIEVINISDKTLARDYYIDVNNGNIVYVAYYK